MNDIIHTVIIEHKGFTARINVHADEMCGPPWEENDGHGPVSEWTSREKHPGERVLHKDRGSCRYYDFQAATRIAKRDKWGLSQEHIDKLAAQLGRKPTRNEIIQMAVELDYEYLRGWCNDEWRWVGFTTEIIAPDKTEHDGESVWGFDDEKYMVKEATEIAVAEIDRLILIEQETQIVECMP